MSLRASSPSAQKLDCARWFESVPERNNAKDPAPLKVKEVWVKERRVAIPPYFARTPVIAPDGKCSAKRLLVILYYERAAVGGMDDGGSNRVGGAL